jgi:transmembrane 9 superfamily protein 3
MILVKRFKRIQVGNNSIYGTGWQLISLCLFCILFAIVGTFWDDRGAFLTCFIVAYCFTSVISGYISSSTYIGYHGDKWKTTMILTSLFFPGVCGIIGSILNTVAIFYGSVMAVPFGYIALILASWIFVTLPLVIFGTILGRNYSSRQSAKKINPYPAPIPKKVWYLNRLTFILVSGILPFGSIFIETYFVFTSFWNYKYYYVYGFMLLVYIILIIVTSCVSIVSTYFLLNSEDYRWPWTSFLSSASTALYVFLYSIYFFIAKTKMNGILQTLFYFGYTGIFCLALGMVCGTVGYYSTSVFIKRIYRDIKTE